jgi:uncharacterized protein YjbI with pentapeptide repeats
MKNKGRVVAHGIFWIVIILLFVYALEALTTINYFYSSEPLEAKDVLIVALCAAPVLLGFLWLAFARVKDQGRLSGGAALLFLPSLVGILIPFGIYGYFFITTTNCIERIRPGENLANCQLQAADLHGRDLSNADLSRSQLEGANLGNANLGGADLSEANLAAANLQQANLSAAHLEHANLSGADLTHANLRDANIADASLEGAVLTDASLGQATWQRISLQRAIGLSDEQLAVALAVPISQLSAALTSKRIRLEDAEQIRQALASACTGIGEPAAATYQSDGGYHPVIILTNKGDIKQEFDAEGIMYEPMALRFAQLVACLDEQQQLTDLETCQYRGGPPITRRQWHAGTRLVEAATGKIIAEQTFFGQPPDACPPSAPQNQIELLGEEVAFGAVTAWLQDYVNPP